MVAVKVEGNPPSEKDVPRSQSISSGVSSEDENVVRGNWTGKFDFIMSCLSYAVGLGNLWRFPYLCYRNGGGAFLIPYVVMLIFTGIPLFFMELSFGQFASEGVISIWKVCPLAQGIGWAMFIVSTFIAIYYNMIVGWTIYYLIASLNSKLPWASCDNEWNTKACGIMDIQPYLNCTKNNGTFHNDTCFYVQDIGETRFNIIKNISDSLDVIALIKSRKVPSDEYFHNHVLDISEGLHDMGGIRWQLAGSLAIAWTLVALCLIRGIKSQGRVVYFTATFPYLVLTVLLVRGATLPGSYEGIEFYLTPKWENLLKPKVWGDAAVQIFFSLSPCWGGLITLASYNKFHNNCLRDALLVSIGNCLTSFYAGFTIFAIIGFLANAMHLKIEDVAQHGAGLAFIVYPEVVARLPIAPLWAFLFFAMLVTLGLGTQFSTVVTVHTTLVDVFPDFLRRDRRPMILMVVICICGFFLGLACTTRGGMYMLQLVDNYAATYSLLLIAIVECLTLTYVYGIDNFMKDIEAMLGYKPSLWWRIMWMVVTPVLLVLIMISTWVDYQPSKYGDYHYPAWADGMGWMITMTSVCAIPTVAIYKIVTAEKKGTLLETIKALSRPTADWGPALEKHRDIAMNLGANIPLKVATIEEGRLSPERRKPLHNNHQHHTDQSLI